MAAKLGVLPKKAAKRKKLCKKKELYTMQTGGAQLRLIMCTLTLGHCLRFTSDEMKRLSAQWRNSPRRNCDDDKLCIIKNFTFRYLTCRVQRNRYSATRRGILAFPLCVTYIFAIFTVQANNQSRAGAVLEQMELRGIFKFG